MKIYKLRCRGRFLFNGKKFLITRRQTKIKHCDWILNSRTPHEDHPPYDIYTGFDFIPFRWFHSFTLGNSKAYVPCHTLAHTIYLWDGSNIPLIANTPHKQHSFLNKECQTKRPYFYICSFVPKRRNSIGRAHTELDTAICTSALHSNCTITTATKTCIQNDHDRCKSTPTGVNSN